MQDKIKNVISWVSLFILFIIALIVLIVYLSTTSKINTISSQINNNNINNEDTIITELKKQKHYLNTEGTDDNNFSTGPKDFKVSIVEFYDFSCSICQKSYPNLRKIFAKDKKYVKITYRDFISSKQSLNLSMMSHCANEQGLFLPIHDYIFQNKGKIDSDDITKIAKQIGLNINQFTKCTKDKKYLKTIQQNMIDAKKLEVKGTPTLFINGYKIEGNIPYKLLDKLVQTLINNK